MLKAILRILHSPLTPLALKGETKASDGHDRCRKRIKSRYSKGESMEINLQISRIRFADQRCRLRSYPATSWSFVMQVVIADGMHTFFNCFRYLDAYYIRVLIAIVSLNARASVESTRVNQICSCIAQSFTNTNTLSTISHLLYR